MKTIAWLFGGFMLLGLSGMIEAFGDTGPTAADRIPVYILALLVLLGAPFSFVMAFRSAWARLRGDIPARPASRIPSPAHRIVDRPAPPETGEFDPDAAFARYMEKRTGQAGEAHPEAPVPATPQAPRPSFGRKVV
jgi:hypothetical protein